MIVFFALVVMCLGLTWVAVISSFRPLVLGASAGWIGLMGFTLVYPPGDLIAGGPIQIIVVIASFAMAILVMVMALGREVQTQQRWGDDFNTSSTGWQLPKWGVRKPDPVEQERLRVSNRNANERRADYRARLRRKTGRKP